ncbi:MAG: phosphotransferase [Gammaproteobacteria bacterium]|nr:phosphotransferase [Gammaproteobacteria bacterium]MCW8983197.1 phosphotransferase [Gammaproteobacteria bacterium]
MTIRLKLINDWLTDSVGLPPFKIEPASEDASFRRYFRVTPEESGAQSLIVMDAPPDKEPLEPFSTIAEQLFKIGLNVPEILARNVEEGFLLLGDLGSIAYLDQLNAESVDRLYGDALGALAVLQTCGPTDLPLYDRGLLLSEMGLFRDWFITQHLEIELSDTERQLLSSVFELLADSALEQPQVPVHRDYHSRNLMVNSHNPGIIDFQDAVMGPVTYDLVSLLRDCYIAWPEEQVSEWVEGYHDIALDHGILRQPNHRQFKKWFDWMGAQRHLKAIGIFARLYHRDGKSGYLKEIPRTFNYLIEVSGHYDELQPFHQFLNDRILTALNTKQQEIG